MGINMTLLEMRKPRLRQNHTAVSGGAWYSHPKSAQACLKRFLNEDYEVIYRVENMSKL
jgi:hypothetical protein